MLRYIQIRILILTETIDSLASAQRIQRKGPIVNKTGTIYKILPTVKICEIIYSYRRNPENWAEIWAVELGGEGKLGGIRKIRQRKIERRIEILKKRQIAYKAI